MHWRHHEQAFRTAGTTIPEGAAILAQARNRQRADRATLELRLGTDALPADSDGNAVYEKAWLFGQPILAMTNPAGETAAIVHVWLTDEAVGAWRSIVMLDGTPPPRVRSKVYDTGDPQNPYVILGVRLRLWNASQDLPKTLVGATDQDPDGRDFLRRLVKRWTPIAQPLVAETVKSAKRPVPENTGERYYKAALGEGQMIRLGVKGPVWVSAEAAVHLAESAGYPLGAPDEIAPDEGPRSDWILLDEFVGEDGIDFMRKHVVDAAKTVERIGYDAFVNEVPTDVLKRVLPQYRWGRGGPMGERLRDDADARYERSLYHGHPVLIVAARGTLLVWLSPIARAEYVSRHSVAAEQDESVPVPRKRGRPKKSAAVEATTTPTETETKETLDAFAAAIGDSAPTFDLEPVSPTPPAPRKRGRPRKTATAATVDTPVTAAAEDAGTSGADLRQETDADGIEPEAHVAPTTEPEPDLLPPVLRRKQRRAVAKLARAIARADDVGLTLVLDDGVLKAILTEGENKGMVAISAGTTPTIATI